MKKTLYIHIGSHKTGSTAIQVYLLANQDALRKKGWFYERHGPDVVRELKHKSLAEISRNPESVLVQYFTAIDQSDCRFAVLSAEGLENISDKSVSHFRALMEDRYDVRIVYYVRRQDERLEAEYKQRVKSPKVLKLWNVTLREGRLPLTFNEFLADDYDKVIDPILDYYKILGRWASVFGKVNIIVRCYEKEQLPEGSVKDFVRTIGIPVDETFREDQIFFNRSFTREETEFIRLCNVYCGDEHDLHDFLVKSFSMLQQVKGQNARKGYLSPAGRREIILRYEESNARVAREYLHRPDGRLFLTPLPDPGEPYEPFEGLTLEDLVPVVTQMLYLTDERHKHELVRLQSEIEQAASGKGAS